MSIRIYDSVEIPLRTRLSRFLSQLKLSLLSLLQAPFRLHQALQPRSKLVPSSYSVFPTESKRPSIYSEIGVGVYQGLPVVFRLMGIPGETSRHWVINNLHSQNSSYIDNRLVSQLCQLVLLLRFLQQHDHEVHDLQKLDGIVLETDCPCNQQSVQRGQVSEGLCDTAKCPIQKVLSTMLGQDNPQAQIQEYLSTSPIFYRGCPNESINQK